MCGDFLQIPRHEGFTIAIGRLLTETCGLDRFVARRGRSQSSKPIRQKDARIARMRRRRVNRERPSARQISRRVWPAISISQIRRRTPRQEQFHTCASVELCSGGRDGRRGRRRRRGGPRQRPGSPSLGPSSRRARAALSCCLAPNSSGSAPQDGGRRGRAQRERPRPWPRARWACALEARSRTPKGRHHTAQGEALISAHNSVQACRGGARGLAAPERGLAQGDRRKPWDPAASGPEPRQERFFRPCLARCPGANRPWRGSARGGALSQGSLRSPLGYGPGAPGGAQSRRSPEAAMRQWVCGRALVWSAVA